MTEIERSQPSEERYIKRESRIPILWLALLVMGPMLRGSEKFPVWQDWSSSYLKRRLEQWGEGYSTAIGPPMPHIAGTLSANDIEALASYLSFVK